MDRFGKFISRRVIGLLLGLIAGVCAAGAAGGALRAAALEGIPEELLEQAWPRTNFANATVDLAELRWGGVRKDGIRSIDAPRFVSVAQAKDAIAPREPVIGLSLNGELRAYPLGILTRHEIVNDVVGGVPVAVTFCPLCNTALVFDRRVGGRVLEFGVSGFLRNSDLVMYDRETESWWQQFVGQAIVGELAGTQLAVFPARLESFASFKARAPEGQVLEPPFGFSAYGTNPYVGYDSRSRPYDFYDGPLPEGIAPLARVVRVGAEAWSLDLLRSRGRIEAGDLVITWRPGQASALDSETIADGAEVGNVLVQRRTALGLEDAPYSVDFAFAFHAFFPHGVIHAE